MEKDNGIVKQGVNSHIDGNPGFVKPDGEDGRIGPGSSNVTREMDI